MIAKRSQNKGAKMKSFGLLTVLLSSIASAEITGQLGKAPLNNAPDELRALCGEIISPFQEKLPDRFTQFSAEANDYPNIEFREVCSRIIDKGGGTSELKKLASMIYRECSRTVFNKTKNQAKVEEFCKPGLLKSEGILLGAELISKSDQCNFKTSNGGNTSQPRGRSQAKP